MDITNTVAVNAKAIRESKKLTLDAAAELTGVSRSMLAQIEKGDVNPTISVLWKMANGYKVSFTTFVEDQRKDADLIPEREPLLEDEGRTKTISPSPLTSRSSSSAAASSSRRGGASRPSPT